MSQSRLDVAKRNAKDAADELRAALIEESNRTGIKLNWKCKWEEYVPDSFACGRTPEEAERNYKKSHGGDTNKGTDKKSDTGGKAATGSSLKSLVKKVRDEKGRGKVSKKTYGELKAAVVAKKNDLVSKIKMNNDLYEIFSNEIKSGPLDGGCYAMASALKKVIGGDLYTISTKDGDVGQHVVLKNGNEFWDGNGRTASEKKLLSNFKKEFMYGKDVQLRPFKDTDVPDSPRSEKLINKIVNHLKGGTTSTEPKPLNTGSDSSSKITGMFGGLDNDTALNDVPKPRIDISSIPRRKLDVSTFPSDPKQITSKKALSQARASDVYGNMEADFKQLALRDVKMQEVTGKTSIDNIHTIVKNAKAEVSRYSGYLSGDTSLLLRDYVDDVSELLQTDAFKNVEAADMDSMIRDCVQKMAYQEIESSRKSYSDHGIRHIVGNINRQQQIMDALGVQNPREKLMASFIMVNHDIGYTTPLIRDRDPSFSAPITKYHPEMSSKILDEQREIWNNGRIFSSEEYDRMLGIVKTHDTSEMSKDDILGTATRLSDNLSLFASEKLPSMFKYVDGASDILVDMGKAAKDTDKKGFKSLQKELYELIDESEGLSTNLKRDLKAATSTIDMMTPKFNLGSLAGEISDISYDGKRLNINIDYNTFDSTLQSMFDMGQKQTKKFLESYKIDDFSQSEYDIGNLLHISVRQTKDSAPGLGKRKAKGTTKKKVEGKLTGEPVYAHGGLLTYKSTYPGIGEVGMMHDFPDELQPHIKTLSSELNASNLNIDSVEYTMGDGAAGEFGRNNDGTTFMRFSQVNTVSDEWFTSSKALNDKRVSRTREEAEAADMDDFDETTYNLPWSTSMMQETADDSRRATAYHETGHAEHYFYLRDKAKKDTFNDTYKNPEVNDWFDVMNNAMKNGWKPPTAYSFKDAEECYAECRSLHRLGKDDLLTKEIVTYVDMVRDYNIKRKK